MKYNIITLHKKILEEFDKDDKKHRERLVVVSSLMETSSFHGEDTASEIKSRYDELIAAINENSKANYIAKTGIIVDDFETILKKPMMENDEELYNSEKEKLENRYNTLARNIIKERNWDIQIDMKQPTVSSCQTCCTSDTNNFEFDENNRKICINCSTLQNTLDTGITHRDYNRVNVVNKFAYSRVIHFQECIKQYQGRQNCKIPQEVYDKLEEKFKSYRLLNKSDCDSIKYSRITKDHIVMFLKQLKYPNQYENINFIYYSLTNKRMDDIEYLEHQLIEDFKELSNLYDLNHGKDKPDELKRKNFMNVQYILYQLLKNHNHPCRIEDFNILKTVEKKKFHDNVCSKLFEQLGWNFTPTF